MSVKTLFFPAVLLACLVTVFSLVKPEWDNLKKEKEKLAEAQEERAVLDEGIDSMEKALEEYQGIDNQNQQLILNALPKEGSNDDFVAELWRNSKNSGVFISGINISEENNLGEDSACSEEALLAQSKSASSGETFFCPSPKDVFSAELEVIGSYLNVKNFISQLDRQNRMVVFEEVALSSVEPDFESDSSSESQTEEGGGEEGQESASAQTSPGSYVLAEIVFQFYSKEPEEIKLSSVRAGSSDVLDGLMNGEFKTTLVNQIKQKMTSRVFAPVVSGTTGKTDLFSEVSETSR